MRTFWGQLTQFILRVTDKIYEGDLTRFWTSNRRTIQCSISQYSRVPPRVETHHLSLERDFGESDALPPDKIVIIGEQRFAESTCEVDVGRLCE